MDKNKPIIQLAKWIIGIILIIFGFYALNTAFFNWWASWGPPTDYPEIYASRAIINFLISLSCFIAAGLIFWFFQKPNFPHHK